MTTNNSKENNISELKALAQKLLDLMSTTSKADVSYDEAGDCYVINIDGGNETGLLIGKKGETLAALQSILGVLFKQKVGEWVRISVNVGDYLEKEESYLKNLALSAAARAKETGVAQNLYNLKPSQRRIIHMILADDKSVSTESVGEGEERYLVVKSS
ncbi:MAG: KH domain-containing protein [Bacteroidales bacterium]|nr:KH domain-containing protein [Bacteroidales bacterium]